jgi:hypothetical protein
VISNDVKNTTLPNLKGGVKNPPEPVAKDFRRAMIKQIILDKVKGQG